MKRRHQEMYAHRDVIAIRRKYNNLHRIQVPRGDPNFPDEVKDAKRIKYKIGQRASLGGWGKNFDLETGMFTGTGVLGQPPPPSPEIVLVNIARNAISPPPDNNTDGTASISVSSSHSRVFPGTITSNRCSRSTNFSDSFLDMMRLQMMHDMQ